MVFRFPVFEPLFNMDQASLNEEICSTNDCRGDLDFRQICTACARAGVVAGKQTHVPGKRLVYGQSITDGCIGRDATVGVLETRSRRRMAGAAERAVA